MNPPKAIALGASLYAILVSISYASGLGSDSEGISQESWLEAAPDFLAWFLPALVAGSITLEKPILVGSVLGLLMVAFDFIATAFLLGPGWAIAALTLFPGTQIFVILSAVTFVYAGWKIKQINSCEANSDVA